MPTAHQVAEKVQARLKRSHFGGIRVDVVPEGVRMERGHWYVPVLPSAEPPRRTDYYDALAEVEGALMDEDNLNILFIPTTPQ